MKTVHIFTIRLDFPPGMGGCAEAFRDASLLEKALRKEYTSFDFKIVDIHDDGFRIDLKTFDALATLSVDKVKTFARGFMASSHLWER
jgi:hypothetical protein